MEPRTITNDGRTLGNAAAAAALCVDPVTKKTPKPSTIQWYRRVGKPAGNLFPEHVYVDVDVQPPQRMYDLDEVAAWHARRKGRGNWKGIGARARKREVGYGTCPTCHRTVGVTTQEKWAEHPHPDHAEVPCLQSGEPAADYTLGTLPETSG